MHDFDLPTTYGPSVVVSVESTAAVIASCDLLGKVRGGGGGTDSESERVMNI